MKKIVGIFLRGIFVLTPIILTFFIVYKVYQFTDGLFKEWLQRAGFYFPGLGMLVTLGVIFFAGLLASNWLTNKLFKYFDKIFKKIPLLGSIYGIIKDTINSFSKNKKGFARLVMINMPNEIKLLGFLTNEDNNVFIPQGYVAVYLMQSMQWAGNLVLVPENLIQPIEVSAEEALKFIASAGLLDVKERVLKS
ncbi:MAG: DUF502 domain-containing protein [Bacillota bacterium]|jgi:uncharacterized membrane protein